MPVNACPKSRSENLVVQNSTKELLIYDLNNNKAFCLNETSALIWQNCDGKNSVSDIVKILENKFKSSVSEDLVLFSLYQLREENLLDMENNLSDRFIGLSRREVIRKVGVSSMIAIPIISAIVAPNAIHAQSCVGMAANFPPGQQTAAGTTANCPTSNICDSQGANCCTAMATITCLAPGTGSVPFTCNCT